MSKIDAKPTIILNILNTLKNNISDTDILKNNISDTNTLSINKNDFFPITTETINNKSNTVFINNLILNRINKRKREDDQD